jgi:hypothetical protein
MSIVNKNILLWTACRTVSNPVHENNDIAYSDVHNYRLEIYSVQNVMAGQIV